MKPSTRKLPTPTVSWLDTVVTMVVEQKRVNSFQSLTMKQVYDRLLSTMPTLTVGQYHDGMRQLHRERRVRLAAFTQALATLPCVVTPMYLDNEVKFYVQMV